MAKFHFRLERVLEYRRLEESWAKEAYLDARMKRLECQATLHGIAARRSELLGIPAVTLEDHRSRELRLSVLDDQERAEEAALSVLLQEEERVMGAWHAKRQEVRALEKLREGAETEWRRAEERKEQAELDEWSVLRRAA